MPPILIPMNIREGFTLLGLKKLILGSSPEVSPGFSMKPEELEKEGDASKGQSSNSKNKKLFQDKA